MSDLGYARAAGMGLSGGLMTVLALYGPATTLIVVGILAVLTAMLAGVVWYLTRDDRPYIQDRTGETSISTDQLAAQRADAPCWNCGESCLPPFRPCHCPQCGADNLN